jgi:hypothetical protein
VRLYGQTFGAAEIERIRGVVAAEAELTRSALSRRVCEWLDWYGPTGQPREVSSRKALLALARQGLISLPAARRRPPQARGAVAVVAVPTPVFEGPLAALGKVELVAVTAGELAAVWHGLLQAHHPLGAGPLCGAQQRYLIHSPLVGWLGGLAFSAAAWQLAARDAWIGWGAHARRANLARVVANSRFLILPGVRVPHLGSHVLGLAARRLGADWARRYGQRPVLLETFVDEGRHAGTVYRAANWQRLGESSGRGRQDRDRPAAPGRKGIYVLPLQRDWRAVLCARPAPVLRRRAALATPAPRWAQEELGAVDLPDGRLRHRLVRLAEAFFAQPTAPLALALHGDAGQTKAAYRFFKNAQVDLPTLLHPHYEATVRRLAAHPRVLVVQDTTSLNYTPHPATTGLGPINTRSDGAQGLKLHDTLALTPEGVPLGLVDIQVWARDPQAMGQAQARKTRPLDTKESQRWLQSFRRTAAVQQLCPDSRLVCIADREADLYELFQAAHQHPAGPALLIRANRAAQRQVADADDTRRLWEYLPRQPLAGGFALAIPSRGGRKARVAALELRHAPVALQPPKRCPGEPPIPLWAVHAREPAPPAGSEAVEWLLLTTVPTHTLEDAFERLRWYSARWNIEVYHRILKSGCRIEDRRLADAQSLQACLALDLVVAWRVMHLAKLGRETPQLPCSVFFEAAEWQALYCYHHRTATPPATPPSLGDALRMVAKIGGFLGRKGDGHPGATVLWRGLDKLAFITETFLLFHPALPAGP